jgi:hypothetical protein
MTGHLPRPGRPGSPDGLESVKKTYQIVGVGLPPGLISTAARRHQPDISLTGLEFNQT